MTIDRDTGKPSDEDRGCAREVGFSEYKVGTPRMGLGVCVSWLVLLCTPADSICPWI